jgi:type I restriction enzyme S subunit
VKSVVRNVVEKSGGTARPFIGLEDVESGTGKLLVDDLPLVAAEDSVLHRPGDVLFGRLRPYLAKSYLPTVSGTATGELLVLRPGPAVDPRFLLYVTLASPWLEWAEATSYGTKMPRTSWEAVGEYRMWLPSPAEQRRIADFLDAETARLGRLATSRLAQNALLAEAVEHAASAGTGRAALRSGALPEKWRGVPLRRVVESVRTGSTPAGPPETWSRGSPEGNGTGVLPWYTPAALDGHMSLGAPPRHLARSGPGAPVPVFRAGSVLVVGIGESLGKVSFLDHDATGNQQLTSVLPSGGVDGRFLAWQLWAAAEEIREWAQYSRIRIINNDSLLSFEVAVPSVGLQREIRRDLDARAALAREFRVAARRFSELIAERWRALVTAAVTGQMDASTAGGRHTRLG